MGKRARFHRRGKRKEEQRKKLSKKQRQTWTKLTQTNQVDRFEEFRSVIIPVIRQIMPSVIAQDLVSVQPMTTVKDIEELGEAIEKTLEMDVIETKVKAKTHRKKTPKKKTSKKKD